MEERLKTEDLMVNDIVLAEAVWYDDETGEERVEWHPFRVTDISSKFLLYCDDIEEGGFIGEWLDDCDAEEIRELRGMPLTEEILHANRYSLYARMDGKEYYSITGDYPVIIKYEDSKYLGHCQKLIELKYIHQLQHILRSCGLKKFANNFKIK